MRILNCYFDEPWVDAKAIDSEFEECTEFSFVQATLDVARTFLENRYLLCLAGNDVASTLYWAIGTNSLAFKEETLYETIPDYFLQPWVHYVPISQGLGDLRDKFEYCERILGLCKSIITNANEAYDRILYSNEWLEAEIAVLDRIMG